MRLDLRIAILVPSIALFLGCLGIGKGDPEGRNAGECSDGADNDGDGDFDCDDEDCAGSPDCEEEEDPGDDSDVDDPEDTDSGDTWDGEAGIDDVTYGYDGEAWHYDVLLTGGADAVTLDITQDSSSPWDEHHELEVTDVAPDGAWERWEVELSIVSDWSYQRDGVSTLYQGCATWEKSMVWRVKDYVRGQVVDCVVWAGDNADPSLLMESGCREIHP